MAIPQSAAHILVTLIALTKLLFEFFHLQDQSQEDFAKV
jgi:hypothetical protein